MAAGVNAAVQMHRKKTIRAVVGAGTHKRRYIRKNPAQLFRIQQGKKKLGGATRKSFSGHLSRCCENIRRRSRKVVAVGLVASAVALAMVGVQEEHRDVETGDQQMLLASPLAASGNSTATMTTFNAGWWGHRLVFADLFESQKSARG